MDKKIISNQQLQNGMPRSVYSIENFEALCRAVFDMDYELSNMSDDLDKYFESGWQKLSYTDTQICASLLTQYYSLNRAYQIAKEFRENKLKLEKEVKH